MSEVYTRKEFVEKYGGFISRAIKNTGILAGTLIAQAIIESQGKVGGSYRVGGSTLSRNANNYFGIKCHNWKGKTYNIDTGEQNPDGSTYVDKKACFRAYNSVEDSILDYIKFLKENSRYEKAGVFKAKTVKDQAQALKDAGYATSIKYADTINSVYNSIKETLDEYSSYGFGDRVKSLVSNPVSFLNRNKLAVVGVVVIATGIGVGSYFYFKKGK